MPEWVVRALRTFFQSFLSYLAVAIPCIDFDSISKSVIIGALMSAVAGGVSAVMNLYDEHNDENG